MLTYFWLGIGGAAGTIFRYWLGGVISNYFPTFPMGTLAINVSGSFLITFFGTLTDTDGRWLVSPTARIFFMTGICGGYTTFSSFSLQTLNLLQDGEWFRGSMNILLSVILCLVGVWLGHLLAAALNQR